MAKLPDNFVKPPTTSRLTTAKPSAPKQVRRARKADLEAEAAPHVPGILIRLSEEEHQALSAACAALATVGEVVSIEDMIKQLIGRWMVATRAMHAATTPALPPPPEPSTEALATPIAAQLRWLAERPLRRWREIGATLRRWSRAFNYRRA
jgi:hypothetical protein